jgi:hypothetical protein
VLTGAQALAKRQHNDGVELWWLELGMRAEEGERECEIEGERCGVI